MKNIKDTSFESTKNFEEFSNFIRNIEETSVWYTDAEAKANTTRFDPIYAEPLCVIPQVEKYKQSKTVEFNSSEEAYADSMYNPEFGYDGSSQLILVNGRYLYPVGMSAVRGINTRAGITGEGFDKLRKGDPKDLSSVLNTFLKHTKGNLTVLAQSDKVRAVNSGKYAICPFDFIVETTKKWIDNNYPEGKFVFGYWDQDQIAFIYDLSAYAKDLFKNNPELLKSQFGIRLKIQASHTALSAVKFEPMLSLGDVSLPLDLNIDIPHKQKGKTAEERTDNIKNVIAEKMDNILPMFNKAKDKIESLKKIPVNNVHNALLRGMKELKVPKELAYAAAEQFNFFVQGGKATAYDCYMAVVDVYSEVFNSEPDNYKKHFMFEEIVAKATNVNWEAKGKIPGEFSW